MRQCVGLHSRRAIVGLLGCALLLSLHGSLIALPDLSRLSSTLHKESSRRAPPATAVVPPACAALAPPAPPAAATAAPTPDALAQYRQLLHAQQARDAPSLRTLLDEQQPASRQLQAPSVTVVLEYAGSFALCLQLSALVQQTQKAALILVSALQPMDDEAEDGAAAARSIVASFGLPEGEIAVVSTARLAAGGDGSGVHALGRIARFQLALQASTRHVLVLDSAIVPPPTLIATLTHVSELPLADMSVLGIAGWRSLLGKADLAHGGDGAPYSPSQADPLTEAVGGASVALPDGAFGLQVHKLVEVDLLRGCWFLRAAHVPLLLREPPPSLRKLQQPTAHGGARGVAGRGDGDPATDPRGRGAGGEEAGGGEAAWDAEGRRRAGEEAAAAEGEEAWISSMLRRHGDLRSLVLPSLSGRGEPPAEQLPTPTARQERGWRRQLWTSIRRGDEPPPWRRRAAPGRLTGPGTAERQTESSAEMDEAALAAATVSNPRLVVPQLERRQVANTQLDADVDSDGKGQCRPTPTHSCLLHLLRLLLAPPLRPAWRELPLPALLVAARPTY